MDAIDLFTNYNIQTYIQIDGNDERKFYVGADRNIVAEESEAGIADIEVTMEDVETLANVLNVHVVCKDPMEAHKVVCDLLSEDLYHDAADFFETYPELEELFPKWQTF